MKLTFAKAYLVVCAGKMKSHRPNHYEDQSEAAMKSRRPERYEDKVRGHDGNTEAEVI